MTEQSLYELVTKANAITSTIIQAGGELTPEIELFMKDLEEATSTKIDHYHFVMKRLEQEQEFWTEEAAKRRNVANSCKKAVERLEKNLLLCMQRGGFDSIQGNQTRAKLYTTKGRLVISDEEAIPSKFKKQVINYEIDSVAVRQALESLEQVPGAFIEGGAAVRLTTTKKEITND